MFNCVDTVFEALSDPLRYIRMLASGDTMQGDGKRGVVMYLPRKIEEKKRAKNRMKKKIKNWEIEERKKVKEGTK